MSLGVVWMLSDDVSKGFRGLFEITLIHDGISFFDGCVSGNVVSSKGYWSVKGKQKAESNS